MEKLADLMEERHREFFFRHFYQDMPTLLDTWKDLPPLPPVPRWKRVGRRLRYALANQVHRLACRLGASCDYYD